MPSAGIPPEQRAGVRMRQEFNRYWARVDVKAGRLNCPPRLTPRFFGHEVAFGQELPSVDPAIVARRLLAAR